MHKNFLIGGFGFNQCSLNCLFKLNLNLTFIDINLFTLPFSLDDMANNVICQLISHKNNTLFAYSTGGLVALRAGVLRPDIIKQIILINSTPKFIEDGNWDGVKLDTLNKIESKLNNLELDHFMAYFVSLSAYPKKIRSNDFTRFFSNNNKRILLNLLNILKISDLRLDLLQLKNKVVGIYADHDVLIAKNTLPIRQIYLPDSTHLELDEMHLLKAVNQVLCNKN